MELDDRRTGETVELLQTLIRNGCVNDGTPDSGDEVRNADTLVSYLEGAGLDVDVFDSRPGRRSLVARIEGEPGGATICLCGHTDVVPVDPDGWSRDPFGGELVEGEVWGRGAVDMLNLTSSMAVAVRHLAATGRRPRNTLIYFGVADEEAGGRYGAEWMVDQHWDAVACDYLLTEMGGIPSGQGGARTISLSVAEKGIAWRRLRVAGTPGHGSMPFGTDNALVNAARVVERLADYRPRAIIHDLWKAQVAQLEVDADTRAALLDPERAWGALETLPADRARTLHACCHTTFSPNMVQGGIKTNVIPAEVVIELDIRTLPGETAADVDAHLAEALGELADRVTVEIIQQDEATASPTQTPMWDVLSAHLGRVHPDASVVPSLVVGGTDARFFRRKGVVSYGAGLFSNQVSWDEFSRRFHGHDERIDVESLGLTTALWLSLAESALELPAAG